MLVRHVLSQLSYAPIGIAAGVHTSATWFIIHIEPVFVKSFFRFFAKNFTLGKTVIFPKVFGFLNRFQDVRNVLRCKGIHLVTELTFHRKWLAFPCDFFQLFSA